MSAGVPTHQRRERHGVTEGLYDSVGPAERHHGEVDGADAREDVRHHPAEQRDARHGLVCHRHGVPEERKEGRRRNRRD